MRSPLPKVLHTLAGRSFLYHVFGALKAAGAAQVTVVVGYGRDLVQNEALALGSEFLLPVTIAVQEEQNGTGHAAQVAFASLLEMDQSLPVLILNGDGPMLSAESVTHFVAAFLAQKSSLCLGAMELPEPKGYGRIVCKGKQPLRIVEEKEANQKDKKIKLVNGGLYIGRAGFFKKYLPQLKPSKVTKELYLTDLLEIGARKKQKLSMAILPADQLRGANDMAEIAVLENIWQQQKREQWMRAGVRLIDPNRTWIGAQAQAAAGVVIEPDVMLLGRTILAEGAIIETGTRLENVQVGKSVRIKAYCCINDSQIGARSQVGPFAHLRPGTIIGEDTKVGNFVEFKKN
jgi:bifunctional UDP-N-acetylglucosamine pyrophosphorylase/glucosamine-1-phosphate N-acetyltransferase